LDRRGYVSKWEAIVCDVMGSLDIEGLFHLGVWCYPEMKEYERWNERREDYVYSL
jgi:hypothetical protein